MAKSNIPFSKVALLSLAVLLSASVAVPLSKRGLLTSAISGLKTDFSNIESDVSNKISTTCSGSSNPLCLGENVVAAVLSSLLAVGKKADSVSNTVGYSNSTDSSVVDAASSIIGSDNNNDVASVVATATTTTDAAATSAHVNILSKVLADVKAIPSEVKTVLDDAGLHLLGVYNMSNAATVLNKVESDTKAAIAKVQSFNGDVKSRVGGVENKIHSAVGNVEDRIHSAAEDVKSKAENVIDTAKSSVDTILHFNSSLGEHLVTSLGDTDLGELAKLVSSAIPGIPNFANSANFIGEALNVADKVKSAAENVITDFHTAIDTVKNLTSASPLEDIEKAVTLLKSVASGAGDNLENAAQEAGSNVISWISYNVKSTNGGDISDVISKLSNFNMSSIASEVNDFITNDGGYKFCLNPSTLLGSQSDSSSTSPLSVIGEVFLNTYGSVDSICL